MKIGYFSNPWNIGHARDCRDILDEVRDLRASAIRPASTASGWPSTTDDYRVPHP